MVGIPVDWLRQSFLWVNLCPPHSGSWTIPSLCNCKECTREVESLKGEGQSHYNCQHI